MKRLLGFLRVALLPLLALAGVAFLVWGVAGWWIFYRELFLEEVAAIEALAGQKDKVEYRRQGETILREYDATKKNREGVPWSVPFVGRVEFVTTARHGFVAGEPPRQVRDRVLQLPGLRGYYDGLFNASSPASPGRSPDDLPLGRPLPKLPAATLSTGLLDEPLPNGEALPPEATRALAKRIYDAWAAERSDRPRLEYATWGMANASADHDWEAEVIDGERRALLTSYLAAREGQQAYLFLETDDAFFRMRDDPGGWRVVTAVDRSLPETKDVLADGNHSWMPDLHRGNNSDPHEARLDTQKFRPIDALGVDGAGVVRIERIDDVRYRIESKHVGDPRSDGRTFLLNAVVRSDLDWGIERYEAINRFSHDRASVSEGVVRLGQVDGEPVVLEDVRARRSFEGDLADYARDKTRFVWMDRIRVGTEFDPEIPKAVFDPQSYERALPEPADLPAWRTYRALLIAGATCLALATLGWGSASLRRISIGRLRGQATARPLTLRFGLATLLSVALLTISLAGWIREKLDDAREERALLAKVSEADFRFRFERRPPRFPWMFLSTDALPLDAPLASIAFEEPAPPEILDSLQRKSPAVEIVSGDAASDVLYQGDPDEVSYEPQIEAIRGVVPELPQYVDTPNPIDPLPTGKRLEGDTKKNVIDMALEAWKKADASPPPRRYVVREDVVGSDIYAVRVTVRDGDRVRRADAGTSEVEVFDGRFLRRFEESDESWRLSSRKPIHPLGQADPPPFERRYGSWEELPSGDDEEDDAFSNVSTSSSDEATAGSMTEVRLPQMPYCVPPCLDGVAPDLDAALRRLTPADVVSAEAIDLNRYRLDLLFPRSPTETELESPRDQATEDRPWVTEFAVVLRVDLDWAVERCEYVDEFAVLMPETELVVGGGSHIGIFGATTERVPTRNVRRKRQVRITNLLEWDDGAPRYDGATFICQGFDDGAIQKRLLGDVRYAVAFPESIPDAVFDRPTLDDPSPPHPEERSGFRWYLATAGLAGLSLVVLGTRRTLACLRKPRGETA